MVSQLGDADRPAFESMLRYLEAIHRMPPGGRERLLGILRSDGTAERALFVIDRKGVIRYIDVHDINERPVLDDLVQELDKVTAKEK